MARIKSLEEIVLSMIDFLRLAQPDANLNPGSVIRDTMIDMPAAAISQLYDELRSASGFQAILSASGSQLDKLARNYSIVRNTGSPARGVAVLTANSLESNVNIPNGTFFIARNGQKFRTVSDTLMDASRPNIYRSNAVRLSNDLQMTGILDQFAIEVNVQAISPGISGRISKYQLVSHSIPGISNITNTASFVGGSNLESDDQFRNRILSIFRGANTGTATAYLGTVNADNRVISSSVIGPGHPLMIRDGTETTEDEYGNISIISGGTGGKADVLVQGSEILRNTESFIFNDRSGTENPSDPINDWVLGLRSVDPELDMAQRRRDAVNSGIYPYQPVDSVVTLSGSLSGANFVQAFVDENGIERGNFKLIKDTGNFRGSPFGFDKIHFISNQIDLQSEQVSKPQLNSKDPLNFTDVSHIDSVYQNISIVREVATTDSANRQFVSVRHTPVLAVDRVTNTTTGERYRIISQNPDLTGTLNTTGRIQIAGATLPRSTDIIEVSYTWQAPFDKYVDYDNLETPNKSRTAVDSVDWGYSSRIESEEAVSVYSVADGYHTLTNYPISRVTNVYTFARETVARSGGKLVLANPILNVASVLDADGREVFFTSKSNGSFSGSSITLPSDSLLLEGESAVVTYNTTDIFSPEGEDLGSFSGNKILLSSDIGISTPLLIDYVVAHQELLPNTSLSSLPAFGVENEWSASGIISGSQPTAFTWVSGQRTACNFFAPSHLRMLISNTPSTGRLLIRGMAWERLNVTYVSTGEGLSSDLSELIRQELGELPDGTILASVDSLESVVVENGVAKSVNFEYDLQNYELNSSLWDREAVGNASLSPTEFSLASTSANAEAEPVSGTGLRISFSIIYPIVERITVAAAGEQISKYKYVFVDEIRVDSGFRNLSNTITGSLTVTAFNQPTTNSQYFVNYSYKAPKEGERITITYNYDSLMAELTSAIETVRPIGGDVLIRKKDSIALYVEVEVTALPGFSGSTSLLQSSVSQRISDFINGQAGGATIDASDIINTVYAVAGVDRVIVNKFNTEDVVAIKKSIIGRDDKFFIARSVVVNIVNR